MRIPEDILAGITLDPEIIINSVSMQTIENTSCAVKIYTGTNVESIGYSIYRSGYSANTGSISSYTTEGSARVYTFTKTGLTAGTKYFIELTPYGSTGGSGDYGNTKQIDFVTTKPAAASVLETFRASESASIKTDSSASVTNTGISNSTAETASEIAKTVYSNQETVSIFQLSNPNKGRTKYITAEKTMSKVSTSNTYFAFGTTMYMKATADTTINSGGISIFSDNKGQTGYYISIQSSDSADIYKQNPFRILKMSGGSLKFIDDSQQATNGKFGAIYNGESYKIDVLVKKTSSRVDIVAYINGFKITASDISSDTNALVPTTNKVSLICSEGTVYFDYVYAMNSDQDQYNNKTIFSGNTGKFSKAVLDASFGEKLIANNTSESFNGTIEEFGTAAREIRPFTIKFNRGPGYPKYSTTGGNNQVTILGQRLNSFGAEIYVLNNSNTFVSLSDGDVNNLWVIGKSITRSGDMEYLEDAAGKFSTPEPVIFDSSWIQKNSDAVALATWIKNSWANKQQIIEMDITGNPLISVGDIVTIKYSYLGFAGTEKFIVTNVSHSYADGLDTRISCRTL